MPHPAMTWALGADERAVQDVLDDWRTNDKVRKLWAKDAGLWSGRDESQWLGWLDLVAQQQGGLDTLRKVAEDARGAGFKQVLLLGMGGSSLCPEVMSRTFGVTSDGPELLVLDSTVPAQVRAFEKAIDPRTTLFVVSSKSGSTTEPNAFKQYFYERVQKAIGADAAGQHFIAITDPDSKLEHIARSNHFRHVFHGLPSVGGRYSALSNFGMVPAALMGVDVARLLERASTMVQACGPNVAPAANPGVLLGAIMGALAQRGRDKVTIVASRGVASLGAWLEQLIAESIGKEGKGLVPIDGEQIGPPHAYGDDRLFVYIRLASAPGAHQDAAVDALEKAGQPVVRIELQDPYDLGQEFFRWEIATAVACSVVGVNAFNQPDVEASKIATRNLTAAFEQSGELPEETFLVHEGKLSLQTDARNAAALGSATSVGGYLAAHLDRIGAHDYFAINAYVEMGPENERELQQIRLAVRDAKKVATTLGFGPRFLHSTGQLHKGGPNHGVFVQITADDAHDVEVPGQKYTFGQLKRFQAQGDFEVLAERGRRALRIHLGPDVTHALSLLRAQIEAVL